MRSRKLAPETRKKIERGAPSLKFARKTTQMKRRTISASRRIFLRIVHVSTHLFRKINVHTCKILSYRLVFDFYSLSRFFLEPLSPRFHLEEKRRLVSVKSSFYVPFSLRPYSRYPGYTTGRFGRFRSPRQPPQAMTTRSKNLGRVTGPRPLRSVPPGRESAPETESPGSLVPKPSVCLPEKNRALRKWRSGRPLLVGVDRKGSAMPQVEVSWARSSSV